MSNPTSPTTETLSPSPAYVLLSPEAFAALTAENETLKVDVERLQADINLGQTILDGNIRDYESANNAMRVELDFINEQLNIWKVPAENHIGIPMTPLQRIQEVVILRDMENDRLNEELKRTLSGMGDEIQRLGSLNAELEMGAKTDNVHIERSAAEIEQLKTTLRTTQHERAEAKGRALVFKARVYETVTEWRRLADIRLTGVAKLVAEGPAINRGTYREVEAGIEAEIYMLGRVLALLKEGK